MRVRGVAFAVAFAALVAVAVGVVTVEPSRAAIGSRAVMTSLRASVSDRSPCGDPIYLRARVRDAGGHGVKGVRARFSFKRAGVLVRRFATTNARGLARVRVTPNPSTAPSGVRVWVAVRVVRAGVTLRARTWFTPAYT
jgi:hypothetical protein